MLIEQIVGNGHRLVVPLRIAGLVAAEQKQRRAARIKRVEHSQVPVLYLARNSFLFAWREVEITSA